jgi:transposase
LRFGITVRWHWNMQVWLDAIAPKVVPDTKLGDVVSYTLNQWDYLT